MKTSDKALIAAGVVGGLTALIGGIGYIVSRRKASTLNGASNSPNSSPTLGKGGGKLVGEKKGGGRTNTIYSGKLTIPDRVQRIQELIAESVKDPAYRKKALAKTAKCPARDGMCEAKAIYEHNKKHTRYTGDVASHLFDDPISGKKVYEPIDLYQSASFTDEVGGGDCDDHVVENATDLLLNGIEAELVVTVPDVPDAEGHIFAGALLGENGDKEATKKKFYALDTTLENGKFGAEVPAKTRYTFKA